MFTYDMSNYRWGQLDIPSRPEFVPAVRRVVQRLGDRAGLTRNEIDDLDLAVAEACANAVRHGSPQRDRNTVTVTFFLAPGCVVVEVRDQGRGFDPSGKRVPGPGEMRDGGYGLHIMRQTVDEVDIARRGGTVVRLMKGRRPRPRPERAPAGAAAPMMRPPMPAFA